MRWKRNCSTLDGMNVFKQLRYSILARSWFLFVCMFACLFACLFGFVRACVRVCSVVGFYLFCCCCFYLRFLVLLFLVLLLFVCIVLCVLFHWKRRLHSSNSNQSHTETWICLFTVSAGTILWVRWKIPSYLQSCPWAVKWCSAVKLCKRGGEDEHTGSGRDSEKITEKKTISNQQTKKISKLC